MSNIFSSFGYYALLGVSKIRKFIKSLQTPFLTIIKRNGDMELYDYNNFIIQEDHKIICLTKNGVKYLSCPSQYPLSEPKELITKPHKYLEIFITPDQIDIVDNFSRYIPDEKCIEKITWNDILKLEGINITYLTRINIIDHDLKDKVINNLLENPYL